MLISRQITSRYDGVIRKIYYEAEEMAQVGKVIIRFLTRIAEPRLTK